MTYFSNHITRKCLVALMEWLSTIKIERSNRLITVPIQYCSHQKFLENIQSSGSMKTFPPEAANAPVEMQWILPRISTNLTGAVYDPERHLSKTTKVPIGAIVAGNKEVVFAPVPYNLEIEVSSIAKTMDDSFQIMEQILPYFQPGTSFDLKLYQDEAESVVVVLNNIAFDFPSEVDENTERLFTISYYFTMRMNYYRPKKSAAIIENFKSSLTPVSPTDTLFEQFVQNANNPYPFSEGNLVSDTVDLTLNKKGIYNPLSIYQLYDLVELGPNSYVVIAETVPAGLKPGDTNWEQYWTLLKVLNKFEVNVTIV